MRNLTHQEGGYMLALRRCSLGIPLALVYWFSLRNPCNSGRLSLSDNMLPISLRPPDWMLRLEEFGASTVNLLLLHQKVNLLLNALQVLVEFRLNLDNGLWLYHVTLLNLHSIGHRSSSLIALSTLASLYSRLSSWFASPIRALLLTHLVFNYVCQLLVNINPIDEFICCLFRI
jgi:hypothetical protein